MALGALDIIIAADTAQLRKGMDTAVDIMQSSTKTMENVAKTAATTIAGVFAFNGIKDSITQTLNLADSLSKMSQKVGVSVDSLYAMQAAGKLSDVSMESLEKGLLKFNKGLGTAQMGSGDTANALKNLGISLKDSSGHLRNSDQYLNEVADKFKSMPDGIAKSTLSMQLFGKSGADLIPLLNGGSESLKEFSGIMDANTGKAAERLNDSFTRMGLAFEGNKVQILTGMLPAIESLSSTMEDFAKWTTANKDTIASFTDQAGNDLTALGMVGHDAFNLISDTSMDMIKIISSVFNEIPNLIGESSNDAINNFGFFEYFILGLSTATNGVTQFISNAKMAYATLAEMQAKYGSVGGVITNGGGRAASARLDYAYAKADADEATKNVVDTYNTLLGLKKQFVAKSNDINLPPPSVDLTDFKGQETAREKADKKAKAEAERYAKEMLALDQKYLGERESIWIKKFDDDLKSQKTYKDDIFQLTATDYEKTQKTIEDKAQLYRESGRTEIEIANFVSLAKGDILEKEMAKFEKEMDDLDTNSKNKSDKWSSYLLDSNIKMIDAQISLSDSAISWANGLDGVAASVVNVAEKLTKIGDIELKTQKAKLEAQQEYQKGIIEAGANQEKISLVESKYVKAKMVIDEKSIDQQIQGYGSLAGAIGGMMKQGSKEAIAMQAIQGTLAIIQGIRVVMNVGASGDGYTAIARMAAAAAVVASTLQIAGLNFSGGGSGGSSTPAPATSMGTVLGGGAYGQSESMTAITDLLSSIHTSEYSQLRDINRAVTSMSENILSAVTNIFRTGVTDTSGVSLNSVQNGITSSMAKVDSFFSKLTGGIIGFDPITSFANNMLTKIGFGGSSKQYIAGSGFNVAGGTVGDKASGNVGASTYVDVETASKNFWGSASYSHNITSTALDSASSQSIALIYRSFSDTMLSINKGLGLDLGSSIAGYAVKAINISTAGLTGEEVVKKLNDTFSALGDTMANDVFRTVLSQYQKLGEGMLETAVRVITEKEVLLQDLANVNKTITGNVLDITQSLVDLSGGLTKFSDANSSYFENYFTDAEKSAVYQKNLESAYKSMNVTMPTTIAGFRSTVDALDLNTASGRETYVSLMNIADAQKTYMDSLKDLTDLVPKPDMMLSKTNDGTVIFKQIQDDNTTMKLMYADMLRTMKSMLTIQQFGVVVA